MLIDRIARMFLCPPLLKIPDRFQARSGTKNKRSSPAPPSTCATYITNETRTAQTNADGRYHFANMPVGAYEITVESTGFAKYQQSGITLALNQSGRG